MTDVLSRGAASVFGFLLVVATTISLMRTVVIPRALRSVISDSVARAVTGTFLTASRLRRGYPARDQVLAWAGPTIIMVQLLTWLFLYLVAYSLLIYGVSGQGFAEAVRQSGSSLFTLGFAAASNENQTIVDFIAAATGPIVIAMLIGFLPTIYATYLEREVDVTMLSAQAGEPAWGPELLSRASLSGNVGTLPTLFVDWSRWAARLRLTHVTYPVLVWVRSARAPRHYIVALIAVMDAAALQIALNRSLPRTQAFGLLLQGGQALEVLYVFLFRKRPWRDRLPFIGSFASRSVAIRREAVELPGWNRDVLATELAADIDAAQGLDRDAVQALARGDETPLRITRADFDHAVGILVRAGFPVDRDLDEAWEQFRVARSRYEFAAYEIARALDATPAPWSGTRRIPTPTSWPTLAVDMLPRVSPPASGTPDGGGDTAP